MHGVRPWGQWGGAWGDAASAGTLLVTGWLEEMGADLAFFFFFWCYLLNKAWQAASQCMLWIGGRSPDTQRGR